MIERPMPQDVLKFKTKFAMGLTMRQCIALVATGATAALGYFVLFSSIEAPKVRLICTALIAIPVAVVGFVEIMGQPFEVVAKDMAIDNFIAPAVRKKEYRRPEFEKFEKDITGEYLKKLEAQNGVVSEAFEELDGKKKKKKSSQSSNGKIKIKKSKEYPGMK